MKLALLAAVVLGLAACATGASQTPISDEDRCTRYGGAWNTTVRQCLYSGGGGGM